MCRIATSACTVETATPRWWLQLTRPPGGATFLTPHTQLQAASHCCKPTLQHRSAVKDSEPCSQTHHGEHSLTSVHIQVGEAALAGDRAVCHADATFAQCCSRARCSGAAPAHSRRQAPKACQAGA